MIVMLSLHHRRFGLANLNSTQALAAYRTCRQATGSTQMQNRILTLVDYRGQPCVSQP
jgi:hypothetical protein